MNRISQISGEAWKNDPIYAPFYHATGFIMAAASDVLFEEVVVPFAKDHTSEVKMLESQKDWQAIAPNVFTGQFPGWRGAWRQRNAGWVFARGALLAVHQEASRFGVKFLTGSPEGDVESLLFNDTKSEVLGARTADGKEHRASLTILAAGAGCDALIDFKKQLRPTAWTLAHIPLEVAEAIHYKGIPVPYNVERGFFIEPNEITRELKICDEHPGYCNFIRDADTGEILSSKPFARNQIPLESESRIRQLLRDTMPQLADRQFSFARICWDADTVDRIFLIDHHPEYASLVLACGGSGHGVNPMPAIGQLVADLLEQKMEPKLKAMSRWRPEQAEQRNWEDSQGRHGANETVMDFKNVKGWTRVHES